MAVTGLVASARVGPSYGTIPAKSESTQAESGWADVGLVMAVGFADVGLVTHVGWTDEGGLID